MSRTSVHENTVRASFGARGQELISHNNLALSFNTKLSRTSKSVWNWLTARAFARANLWQVITGSLSGTVRDSSEAAIVGAKVTVLNQDMGIQFEVSSNDQGDYVAPYLPPGTYRLSAEFAGFRTAVSLGNVVQVNQKTRVDFRLEVGEITQTVEVTASALQLQTGATTVQNVTGERVIQAVPNISHNPLYYAGLQPGVVPRAAFNDTQSVNSFGIGIDGRRTFSALSINGGQAMTNDVFLDGISVQGSAWNEVAVLPNQDGVQEVRTVINNFSAEYGRAQGVIAIRTKSGTNDYHGSLPLSIKKRSLQHKQLR